MDRQRACWMKGGLAGGNVRRPCLQIYVALAAVTLLFAMGTSSAFAGEIHPFVSSFSGSETLAGSFVPFGVAVDNSASVSAGDTYIVDLGSASVEKFDGSGKYLPPSITGTPEGPFSGFFFTQDAVDASGDVFVGDPGHQAVDEFNAAGEYVAQISLPAEPAAIAVDSLGRVLIAVGPVVYRYDPKTASLSEFAASAEGQGFLGVAGVAADDDPSSPSFGDVYIVEAERAVVYVFDSFGAYKSKLTGTSSGSFSSVFRDAVDPTSGDLYVTTGNAVDEFDPSGAFVSEIIVPNEGFPTSVAIAAKTGDVYVADVSNGIVDVFGPGLIIPDANVEVTSNVEPTSVVVHGKVNPAGGGEVISCIVEYGESTSYGKSQLCVPLTPYAGSKEEEVSAELAGLTPDTAYHFRIVASNANGAGRSGDASFETTGPPTIGEVSSSGRTRTTATLNGHLDPHGFATSWRFEYGKSTSYEASVPIPDGEAGSGFAEVPVSGEVSGLEIGTTYHYRLVATSQGNTVAGPDSTFTTQPVAAIEDLSAIAGPHDATVRAMVEDFGTLSTCEFEYVTDAQFTSSGYTNPTLLQCTPQQLAASGGELHAIARPKGLKAGTIYHYRFIVGNEYGEQQGSDQTFTTFGLAAFSLEALEREGGPDTQAGGHPYVLTTNVVLSANTDQLGNVGPAGSVKDVNVHLPAGLIGNPLATPRCTRYDSERQDCSGASQIGMIVVQLVGHGSEGQVTAPLFNLVPPSGVAAEFSARFSKLLSAFIDARVRTGSDYGIDADSLNITTDGSIGSVQVQVWGVPADASHDEQRRCPQGTNGYGPPGCVVSAPLRPFLTNPTSCLGPLTASVQADTYQAPNEFAELSTKTPAITGCERLHFTPTISIQPEASAADSPTGLHVDLHIPQEENATGLAEADLKDTTVTLPQGLAVNPAGANGLTACSEAQIELHGPEPATCPDSSKVGTVELVSPLVDHPLHGAVYVAQQGNGGAAQGSNPFGSLLALYVAIDDPETGVVVKQAGKVTLDTATGQLTATFSDIPQLPFEDLKLDFFGGPRAALVTPPTCASYAASASFASWAAPTSSVSPFIQPFAISTGPDGAPCPAGGFAPAFTAGTHSAQAGAFTPLTVAFSRQDGEQGFTGLETTLPPGLLAKLAGVPLCGAQEAAAGTCPASSQIGSVSASAGAGPDPVSVQGQIYLTGPYNGGPFGEVVEVPAIAGPFNLGTVAVRGAIHINPSTAQATVVSDPFPTTLEGVLLRLKRVAVTIDRAGFTFNPTNCSQLATSATITGEHGASAALSAPFAAANCATLPFKPGFKVSTQAKTGKKNGASLSVKVTSGAGQANIGKVKVDLPKQLPSRLSTLQKACVASVFEANPAACPAGSMVGSAKAITPVLTAPLTGPAYLVSHGGAAFPDLEIVLQGERITLVLDGKTHIKNGITSSSFNTVPDAPIKAFELVLPEGPHSVLSAFLPPKARGSMCGQKLSMPTRITGQNGAVIKKTTKIAVTGCPKKHKAKTSGKAKTNGGKKGAKR